MTQDLPVSLASACPACASAHISVGPRSRERFQVVVQCRDCGAAWLRDVPQQPATFSLDDVPEDVRENKRYKDQGDFTIEGLTRRLREDFGEGSLDIVVHSLANGPEVKSPLVDTSRAGYLAAVSVSAYSNVSLVRSLSPHMRSPGAFLSLTYLAGERVIHVHQDHVALHAGHSGDARLAAPLSQPGGKLPQLPRDA